MTIVWEYQIALSTDREFATSVLDSDQVVVFVVQWGWYWWFVSYENSSAHAHA